jgi:hypothetical protein
MCYNNSNITRISSPQEPRPHTYIHTQSRPTHIPTAIAINRVTRCIWWCSPRHTRHTKPPAVAACKPITWCTLRSHQQSVRTRHISARQRHKSQTRPQKLCQGIITTRRTCTDVTAWPIHQMIHEGSVAAMTERIADASAQQPTTADAAPASDATIYRAGDSNASLQQQCIYSCSTYCMCLHCLQLDDCSAFTTMQL